ncbi:MAG: NAD-dependent epimerase/dehydratase family protein [Myxococcales bacterium]|nr:NAD-dependent epimerase/dehydratase family protein [Myxococcales bacterium]
MDTLSLSGATVAVTGGAGFIGSHLVRRLLAERVARIVVLDSLRYGDPANLTACGAQVTLIPFTLGTDDPERLRQHLTGVDYLFHLAAEKHNQSKDEPSWVLRANIEGTQHLYEAAGQAGIRRVVYSSSLYAYGRMNGPPFREDEIPAPKTVYGISKLAGEHLLRYAADRNGLSWNVVRFLFVYGPYQYAGQGYKSVILRNFERLLRGEAAIAYGDGGQILDYVFVDDAVEATLRALTCGVSSEVFNVGSGVGVRVIDLLEMMRKVSGRDVAIEHGPADWTAGSSRLGNVEKAHALLGWRATTPLEEGLRQTYAWIRAR